MNQSALTTSKPTNQVLSVTRKAGKDYASHLKAYIGYLDDCGGKWFSPDLPAYAEHLLGRGLAPTSALAHLSHIRARYAELVLNRDLFFGLAPDDLPFLEKQAFANEVIKRIENAMLAKVGIKAKVIQDVTANAHLRLTPEQANRLLKAPNPNSLVGMRDKAIFALMLATGIRADELTALTVSDLRQQTADGELALLVREGKGNKQRLIPYGDLDACLVVVEKWLTFAGISEGIVFRAILKSGRVAGNGLTVRSIENFLNGYEVVIQGKPRQIKPHDLRRTYAARMYEAGMGIVAIQQNLGHSDLKTTQSYIGDLGGKARRGKAVFDFGE